MQIEYKDLMAAVTEKLITQDQATKLWAYWRITQPEKPSFRFTNILYYFGGIMAISAMTIYVTMAWDQFKGFPLLFLALAMMLLGLSLTHYFLDKKLRIPAGLMAAFSLALVPLVVFNIQFLLGMSPNVKYEYSDFHYWIDWYWYNMELATLIVGVIMLYFYRLPFLVFPIAVIIWYMSMDLWPLINQMHQYSWQDRSLFSLFFGLFLLAGTMYVDLKYDHWREDYLFWLYIVGVIVFWGGLSSLDSSSELGRFGYFVINLSMLFVGAFLNRRVFAVFAVFGMLGYFGHLAFTVFADSLGFPIVMVMVGILIIFTGVFFSRVENRIKQLLRASLPASITRRIE